MLEEELNIHRQAAGKIAIAIQRLADRYPFHAKTLERFDVYSRPAVGTMAVSASAESVQLLHDPDFVLNITADELAGVLLHEVHHVVFGHLLSEPADYPDRWARTIAEEVTVNEPLPGGGITLDQFPALRPMETTDDRYRRLKKRVRRPPLQELTLEIATGDDDSSCKDVTDDGSGQTKRKKASGLIVVDNHDVWRECADREQVGAMVRVLLHDVAIEVGSDSVPDYLRDALRCLGIGDTPGDGEYCLVGGEQGQLDWRRLLRRYVGRTLTPQPDFKRPPRRFPTLVGVIPGRSRQAGRPDVMAVIDTSGSISDELLEQINGELVRIASAYRVTVVECDVAIRSVYEYRSLKSAVGRGGTDLRPPFQPAFLRRHRPDLIVYFTDGYGPAPDRPPSVPAIWCLSPGGRAPEKWGRVIEISHARTEYRRSGAK